MSGAPLGGRRGRVALLAFGGAALMTGMWAGLQRLGLVSGGPAVAMQHGPLMVSGFLAKPVDGQILLDLLAELLGVRWLESGEELDTGSLSTEMDVVDDLVAPAVPVLDALRQLAELGNMTELASAAERLADQDSSLRPLADALRAHAAEFDDAAAVRLLQMLSEEPIPSLA